MIGESNDEGSRDHLKRSRSPTSSSVLALPLHLQRQKSDSEQIVLAMATQVALAEASSTTDASPAIIALPPNFGISPQDGRLEPGLKQPLDDQGPGALGILVKFTGTFAGTGLNTIFRPNSGPPNGTVFANPVNPPPPTPPSENTLELNLTSETLAFSKPLNKVPNRGLELQQDITLNGVPYFQVINDVANPKTGLGDAPITSDSGIHVEPGLWMHVPATTTDPVLGESLVRMGSIPHGTTINAQCLAPPVSGFKGPPKFQPVDITPFPIGNPSNKIRFAAQTVSNPNTPRIPQDLSKFSATGTITQAILDDPNTVLRNAIVGQTITQTTVFTVSTVPTAPEFGGGTANIAFLQGATAGVQSGPNASAVQMSATFWVEEVEQKIVIPVFKAGGPPIRIPGDPAKLVPSFVATPPKAITTPTTITVTNTQIQYSQLVFLNFAGLTWPHASCATLIPQQDVPVPASAFG